MKSILYSIYFLLLLSNFTAVSAVVIDGKLDDSAWKKAQVFNDFRLVTPRTGEAAPLKTQAFFLPQKDGLYVAFINEQNFETRRRSYSDRDQSTQAEKNTFVIDFNDNGDQAFSFEVSLGRGYVDGVYALGSDINTDWDGPWDFAVSEDDKAWYSEIFIPWKVATLSDTEGAHRQFKVWFSRFNTHTAQRYATPYTSDQRSNFTRELYSQPVDNIYQSTGLDFIPYITTNHDGISHETRHKVGADVFWKFTNNQQVIAAINPDFGAVESDDIVINYTSVEELRSDKRAFFTENQSLFDVQSGDTIKMLYTRRIGAGTDGVKEQQADIDFAGKYLFMGDKTDLGLLIATEKDKGDALGKDFYSLRWKHRFDSGHVGQIVNLVERPSLEKTAITSAVDYNFWHQDTQINGMFIHSQIDNSDVDISGKGGFFELEHYLRDEWSVYSEFWYLTPELNIDDFGYLERNDFKSFNIGTEYEFALNKNPYIREIYYGLELTLSENFKGHRLADEYEFEIELSLQNTANLYFETEYRTQALNDQLTWGDSSVMLPEELEFYVEYESPQSNRFQYTIEAERYQSGLNGWGNGVGFGGKYAITDNFIIDASYYQDNNSDWLIGTSQQGLSSYQSRSKEYELKAIYMFAERHQIALNGQWSGLKASGIHEYHVTNNMPIKTAEIPDNFDESILSLQLKYRFKFAAMSDFYLVYTRNGEFYDERQQHASFSRQISLPFKNPDNDQLIMKVRWVL